MSRSLSATGAISSFAGPQKKPAADGGWNIFGAGWVGADMLDPALNRALRANDEPAWFGWPKDDRLEELRAQWLKASDNEARQGIAAAIQLRAFETDRGVEDQDGLSEKPQGSSSRPAIFQWNVENTRAW